MSPRSDDRRGALRDAAADPTLDSVQRIRFPAARPRLDDAVLGLALSLAVAVAIASDFDGQGAAAPGAYLFAAGFGALVAVRRAIPRLMLVATVLGIFVYYMFDFPAIGIALPAMAALYSGAERGYAWWSVASGVVLVAVAGYFRVDEGQPLQYLYGYELITNLALVAAAIALGVAVRLNREVRERTGRVRALTVEREVRAADETLRAERLRIARDLHDVVGHHLSVAALHASVAAEAIGTDPRAAAEAIGRVRESTATSLRELRAAVGVLRERGDDVVRGPVGLAGLDALCGPLRAAGVEIVVRAAVNDGDLDGSTDTVASRIIQESITNVLRHAQASRVAIDVHLCGDRLVASVVDDGRGPGAALREGTGIRGMRERAALVGGAVVVGAVDAGANGGGGFAVRVELPRRAAA